MEVKVVDLLLQYCHVYPQSFFPPYSVCLSPHRPIIFSSLFCLSISSFLLGAGVETSKSYLFQKAYILCSYLQTVEYSLILNVNIFAVCCHVSWSRFTGVKFMIVFSIPFLLAPALASTVQTIMIFLFKGFFGRVNL